MWFLLVNMSTSCLLSFTDAIHKFKQFVPTFGCHGARCRWIMMQKWNVPLVEPPNVFPSLWRSPDLHRCSEKMTNFFWKLPRKKENSYSRIKNHTLPHNKRKMWVDIIFRYLQVEEFLMAIFGWKTILSQSGIISVLIQVLYSWKNEELESGSPKTHRLQIGEDGFNWLQLFICRGIMSFSGQFPERV